MTTQSHETRCRDVTAREDVFRAEPLVGLTRRQVVTGAALALGGLAASALAEPARQATSETSRSGATAALTALHQEIELASPPARIYAALVDAKQFAAFSGMAAEIDGREGGACTLFGGMIVARNVELVVSERIVQAWRPTHWDAGVWSLAEFQFRPSGAGTLVILDHKGFPGGDFESLSAGWYSHYWEPLKKYLG